MKPTPAGDTLYDDKRGKFAEVAGPNGNPDLFEETLMALMDGMGIYLRHDLSDGPKNYQTFVNGTPQDDFHSDSVPRGGLHWEGEKAAHLQYTPLDNLAMFGWMTFVAKWQDPDPGARAAATRLLGWPLQPSEMPRFRCTQSAPPASAIARMRMQRS